MPMHAAIVVLLAALGSAPAQPADPLTLETALTEAGAREPGLAGAQAREAVAQGELEVARTLAPLSLSLAGGGNDPRWSVGVAQRLPVLGARSARIAAAEQGVRSAEQERRATQARVRAETRKAYFSLVHARQLAEAASRALEITRQSEEAARLRFSTGAGPELDLVQAGLDRASAEVRLLTQQGEVEALSTELSLLLGRDPHRVLEPAGGKPPALPSLEEVLGRAQQAPRAQALEAAISGAEATLRAAHRERWPSPSLGVSVEGEGPRGANVFLRGSLDLEVPVPGLGRGEVDRAEASLVLARATAGEERQRRLAEIIAAHQRLSASLAALARFPKEILPAADRTEQMALESYRVGRSPLSSLNDARRAAADTRAQAAEAAFAAQAAFAGLELAAGIALDEN
jgi:cobalt-zinc-cadmium efflux system outer membrane protein